MTLSPPNPTAWRPIHRTRHEGYEAWALPEGGMIYVRRTDAGLEAQWATDGEFEAMVEGLGARVTA